MLQRAPGAAEVEALVSTPLRPEASGPGIRMFAEQTRSSFERRPRPLMRRPPEGGRERDVVSSMRRPSGAMSRCQLVRPSHPERLDSRLQIEAHPRGGPLTGRTTGPLLTSSSSSSRRTGSATALHAACARTSAVTALVGLHPARVGSFFSVGFRARQGRDRRSTESRGSTVVRWSNDGDGGAVL